MKTKRQKPKMKTNSHAIVMTACGLLDSPAITAVEIKHIYKAVMPPPPPMSFNNLKMNIEKLKLDSTILNQITPKIDWHGKPYHVSNNPYTKFLHLKEANVSRVLRLTPLQYLAAKYTLISSARRYAQKFLPFRKSDAQKLLRMDVNKASKLWEFFKQANWI